MSRSEQWAVGEHVSLDVRVPSGSVEVRTGDAGVVHITIDAVDVDDFEVSNIGDRVTVRHPSKWRMRGRSSRVVCYVPSGADVEISTASSDVRTAGRLGNVKIRSASGDIELGDAAKVDVTTASGDLSCGRVSDEVSITSISGDCVVHGVGGRLVATLTSGDLKVDVCAGDVNIGSTSGDVRIGECDGSDIVVRSISGDVRLGLPTGIRVDADISTMSGRASLPESASAAAGGGERRPVRLQLKSVSGDIRVERVG
jgi:DUF4097 and DUF4098 domain-containing protein YvlB